jgi:hypothetical protein
MKDSTSSLCFPSFHLSFVSRSGKVHPSLALSLNTLFTPIWKLSGSQPLITPLVPVLMHTSREARSVALNLYEKIQLLGRVDPFGSRPYPQPPHDNKVRYRNGPTYFNFKLDTYAEVSWNGSNMFYNDWEHQDLIPDDTTISTQHM